MTDIINPVATVSKEGFDFSSAILLDFEGKFYPVSHKALQLCTLLVSTTKGISEGDEAILPMAAEANADALALIIGFCEYHKDSKPDDIPQPLEGPLDNFLGVADKAFVKDHLVKGDNNSIDCLNKVMATAHYLGCDCLVNLCCAKLGSMIQGKTAEEVRVILGMPGKAVFREDQKFRTAEEIKAFSELKAEHPDNATKVAGPDADTKVNRD